MNFIARPANFSSFFEARITGIGRELSRWRNWKEEAVMLMGRCAIFFSAAMAQSVG